MSAHETLSEQILRENAAVFEAMLAHRFVRDIEADRLPTDVFHRYLAFEGTFVDTAFSIFAYGCAKAHGIEDRCRLVGVLDALVNEQIPYFERTFAARDIGPSRYDLEDPRVAAFRDEMLAFARDGSFVDMAAAMFAAEWMYWTWCERAAKVIITDPLLREWVELHAEPGFRAQAEWLRRVLDEAGSSLTRAERSRLSFVFGRAQQLEIDFHDAAYAD